MSQSLGFYMPWRTMYLYVEGTYTEGSPGHNVMAGPDPEPPTQAEFEVERVFACNDSNLAMQVEITDFVLGNNLFSREVSSLRPITYKYIDLERDLEDDAACRAEEELREMGERSYDDD